MAGEKNVEDKIMLIHPMLRMISSSEFDVHFDLGGFDDV